LEYSERGTIGGIADNKDALMIVIIMMIVVDKIKYNTISFIPILQVNLWPNSCKRKHWLV